MKRGPFAVLYDTISPSCLLFMLSKIYAFSFSAVSAPLSANKRATALIHGVNMLSRRTADRLSKCGKRKFADMRWQQAYFPQFLRESCSTSKINAYHGTCLVGVADSSAPTWFLLGVETVL